MSGLPDKYTRIHRVPRTRVARARARESRLAAIKYYSIPAAEISAACTRAARVYTHMRYIYSYITLWVLVRVYCVYEYVCIFASPCVDRTRSAACAVIMKSARTRICAVIRAGIIFIRGRLSAYIVYIKTRLFRS